MRALAYPIPYIVASTYVELILNGYLTQAPNNPRIGAVVAVVEFSIQGTLYLPYF